MVFPILLLPMNKPAALESFDHFAFKPLQTAPTLRNYGTTVGSVVGNNGELIGTDAGDVSDPYGRFGQLSRTPGLDLDADGVADLVIGLAVCGHLHPRIPRMSMPDACTLFTARADHLDYPQESMMSYYQIAKFQRAVASL